MKNFLLVGILFVLWFASMRFYLPLAVMVMLFAALVSSASIVTWLSLMKRRASTPRREHCAPWGLRGRSPHAVVEPDAKT